MDRTLGKIFLGILSFLFVLVLVEVGARIFFPENNPSDIDEFQRDIYAEPRPYVMHGGTRDPELAQQFNLNSLGYRGPEPHTPKAAGEYRIALVGGSVVVVGDPSLSTLLENNFRRDGRKNVHVYNFGVMASNTRMDLTRALYEVVDYQPDLVIFYGGGNDFNLPFHVDPRPSYPYNFVAYERNPLLLSNSTHHSYSLLPLFLYQSRFLRLILGGPLLERITPISKLRREIGWGTPGWTDRIARDYLHDVALGAQLLSGLGIETRFVLQPFVCFKEPQSAEETKYGNEALCAHAERFRATVRQGLSALPTNTKFEDISDLFDGMSESVFRDDIHLLQTAQSKVADKLYSLIARSADNPGRESSAQTPDAQP